MTQKRLMSTMQQSIAFGMQGRQSACSKLTFRVACGHWCNWYWISPIPEGKERKRQDNVSFFVSLFQIQIFFILPLDCETHETRT